MIYQKVCIANVNKNIANLPLISIITATFNTASDLPRLIEALRNQTNKNFEWVVADGGSTDKTLECLTQIEDINVLLDSRPDFGIYDALNRAIKLSSGDYYLVLGADDELYADSIDRFMKCVQEQNFPDLIVANVEKDDGLVLRPVKKWKFLYSQRAYVASHAVGTLIKKNLHSHFGYYSSKFPIAADQFFLKKVGDAGCTIKYAEFIAGKFGSQGVSNSDMLGSLTEFFRIQIMTGECKYIQVVIYFLRVLKNIRRFGRAQG